MSTKAKNSVSEDLIQEERFAEALMSQFFVDGTTAKSVRPEVGMALSEYFGKSGNRFTGSQFEELLDASHPNRITERDLLAVTTLNVNVPPRAALWILSDEGQRKTSELLKLIPDDSDIWDPKVRDVFAESGPVQKLWNLLGHANWPKFKAGGGLGGYTKRSKILAAKRPRLIPVLDSVVLGALPLTRNRWISIQNVLVNGEWRESITNALNNSCVPKNVSLLRRMDAVIWLQNRPRHQKVMSDN